MRDEKPVDCAQSRYMALVATQSWEVPIRTRCTEDKRPLGQLDNKIRSTRAAKEYVDGTLSAAEAHHRQTTSFRRREGAFLPETPDLVIHELDGPRSFTLIDIKIMDPAASSHNDMRHVLQIGPTPPLCS